MTTLTCPACARPHEAPDFATDPHYCSIACYCTGRGITEPATQLRRPEAQSRRPTTIYQCDTCATRALGHQRCDTCDTSMRRVGPGGSCPSCHQPVAVADLIDEEV